MLVREEEWLSWLSSKVWVDMERLSINSSLFICDVLWKTEHISHTFTQVGGKRAGNSWFLATGGRLPLLSADMHLQNTEYPGSSLVQLHLSLNLQQHQVESASESRGRLPDMGKKVPIGWPHLLAKGIFFLLGLVSHKLKKRLVGP